MCAAFTWLIHLKLYLLKFVYNCNEFDVNVYSLKLHFEHGLNNDRNVIVQIVFVVNLGVNIIS